MNRLENNLRTATGSNRQQSEGLVRLWARSIASMLLALILASLSTAQAARQPEPVSSVAAQMIEQLQVGDWRNWILKAEALDYLGRNKVTEAAPEIKKILKHTHPNNRWLRGRALMALARIQADKAISLATAYAKDPHVEVRAAVAEICAELPVETAAPIIKQLLAEKTPLVHFHALAAHARHHGKDAWTAAEPAMANIPDSCIEPAARTLGLIGTDPALERLLKLAQEGKQLPLLLRGLDELTTPGLATFYFKLLMLPDSKLSFAETWQALRLIDRKAVIAACRQALSSGNDQQVRVLARFITSHVRDPELGESLKTALMKTKDPNTLLVGLAALSCLEADQYRQLFVTSLDHKNAAVRASAVRCLTACPSIDLYDVLKKSLTDSNSKVRLAALAALKKANPEEAPKQGFLNYFTPSLLSKDAATRQAAVAAVVPHITMDNGDAALKMMKEMQGQFGIAGTEPLMRATFRMIPEEKSAEVLEFYGYITRWQVIGEFPLGWGSPANKDEAIPTVFPPEQRINLKETLTVKYNEKGDTRFGKKIVAERITWVAATVGNSDGVLFMTKAGRSQLQTPHRHGTCYAYTEIIIPEKMQGNLEMVTNMNAGERVWLNGKAVTMKGNIDKKQGTATKTAQVTLNPGKNTLLVKVWSNDHSPAWWAPKVSTRGFSLSLRELTGKPIKRSYK